MSGFTRHRRSKHLIATFSGFEADLLRSLAAQLVELRRNEEAASEFRRFTEGSLRDGKAAGAATIIDALEDAGLPAELGEDKVVIDVELEPDAARVWLKTFTDLRLALATRLGVEEGDGGYWHSLPDDDPRAQAHEIYEWVGYLQETLVQAMTTR